MPGLLYYLPDRRGVTPEQLKELGLGHAFDPSAAIAKRGVNKGPDGGPGLVVADVARVPAHQAGFHPATQAWRKIPGSRSSPGEIVRVIWVGRYTDAPVLPSDLARRKQLDGYQVTLGDEQPWLIPLARGRVAEEDSIPWYCALPEAADVDESGAWISRGVVAKYEQLWRIAEDYWDVRWPAPAEDEDADGPPAAAAAAAGRVRVTFDFAGLHEAATAALAVNYHLAKTEAALLGLLTDECSRGILDALVDWPVVEQWMKKKLSAATPGASPTGDGPAAETPATDRP